MTTLPGDFVLHDISADGRVLLGRISESSEILGDFPGEARPRNLSHLDRSVAADLAPSGDTLLFNEMGQGGRSAVSAADRRLAAKTAGRRLRVGALAGRKVRARQRPSGPSDLPHSNGTRAAKTHRHARAPPRGTDGVLPGRSKDLVHGGGSRGRTACLGAGSRRGEAPRGHASGGRRDAAVGRRTLSLCPRGRWRLDPLFNGDDGNPQGRRPSSR